jgi:hypothetical protein
MRRPYASAPGIAGLVICATLLSACGSQALAHDSGTAAAITCAQVSAVLSDGPDPGADPVGYAEAQILPLHQIRTSDTSLRAAIDDLASAYQQFSSTNGSGTAKQAVSRASGKVNAICPGTAS